MNYEHTLLELKEISENRKIAILKINRPNSMNALNSAVLTELEKRFQEIEKDDTIQIAILTGEGKAFVAGADITEMQQMTGLEAYKFSQLGHQLMNFIENMNTPSIAAINGFALGGGLELAMACDFSIASEKAKFGQPEINLGIIPGFGGTQRLTRCVGKKLAKYLIMTGDMISAEEAFRIGLVEKLVSHDNLINEAEKIAKKIATKSAPSVSLTKKVIDQGYDISMMPATNLEVQSFGLLFSSKDQKEGMTAFLEKRKAEFINK